MPGPCVWWIRNDPRLQDNPVLRAVNGAALCDQRPFAAVYVFDPRFLGHGKTDVVHARFIVESVQDVGEQLAQRGSKLFVCQGRPEDVLSCLPRGTEAKCLSEPCSAALGAIDKSVEEALVKVGSKLRRDPGAAWLYHPHDWPYSKKTREELGQTVGLPQSYDKLAEALGWKGLPNSTERSEDAAPIRPIVPAPAKFPSHPDHMALPGLVPAEVLADVAKMLEHLGYSGADVATALAKEAQPGECAARTFLDKWAKEGAAADGDAWAQLSQYMETGCLTAREVYACAVGTPQQAEVVRRLLWREFRRLHGECEDKEPDLTVSELKEQLMAKDKIIEELRKAAKA